MKSPWQKISKEFKITTSSIYYWIEQFNKKELEGLKVKKNRVFKPKIPRGLGKHDFRKLAEEANTPKEKRRFLVFAYLVEGKSEAEITRDFKITRHSVYNWMRLFKEKGIEGLKAKKNSVYKRRIPRGLGKYDFRKLAEEAKSPKEKRRFLVFAYLVEGKSEAEITRDFKITRPSVYNWMRLFKEKGIEGLRCKRL